MSQFHAYDFIFDGVSSKTYDLNIISFDDGSLFSGVGSSNVNIITQRVLRKSKVYYLGRTQEPVLEFSLTFATKNPINGLERDTISAWLFGRSEYKKLYILQDDLNGAYFNCFLTNPEPLYIGSQNYAFSCTVTCDSPFAYSYPKKTSGSYTATGVVVNAVHTIHNRSSEDEYLYPDLYFKVKTTGSTISLTNEQDNNRVTTFGVSGSPLNNAEQIYVNNDLQILQSGSAGTRLPVFNKAWLRLVPGKNNIRVQGHLDWFQIMYNEKMKIGG